MNSTIVGSIAVTQGNVDTRSILNLEIANQESAAFLETDHRSRIEFLLVVASLPPAAIVIQSDDKLVALVHPDMEEVNNLGFTDEDLENIMEQNRKELNMQIPSFAKVSRIKLHNQEFEKTAKKSIKRYLYQNAI